MAFSVPPWPGSHFFSCRSWSSPFPHDPDLIFLLQVMVAPILPWLGSHFFPLGHGRSCSPMTRISFFPSRSWSLLFSHDSIVKFSLRVILSWTQGKGILHNARRFFPYYAANFCRTSDKHFLYIQIPDSIGRKKKISSKRIQPTGFWTVHIVEALFCDCSCVPWFRIIAWLFHVMKNYPKSLQELIRRKSGEKVGIVQSPSTKKLTANFLFYIFKSGIYLLEITYLIHVKIYSIVDNKNWSYYLIIL